MYSHKQTSPKANVAHYHYVRRFTLDRARSPLHDAILGPGARGHFIFLFRQPKQNYR
jgi:hypothetical protein